MNPAANRPAGLSGVMVVNTVLALICAGVAWNRYQEGHLNVIAIGATVALLVLGPGLLVRTALVWRCVRPLTYVFAMMLSLLLVFSVLEGQFAQMWMFYVLLVPIVIYLIGVRGYLGADSVRGYFGVEPAE